MKNIILAFTVFYCSYMNGQDNTTKYKNYIEEFSREELKKVLVREKEMVVNNRYSPLIKSDTMAIEIIEPILFDIYGEKNIIIQRPYNTVKIDNYYVISGTLPKGYIGGVFVVIIDENDLRVLDITHYK